MVRFPLSARFIAERPLAKRCSNQERTEEVSRSQRMRTERMQSGTASSDC